MPAPGRTRRHPSNSGAAGSQRPAIAGEVADARRRSRRPFAGACRTDVRSARGARTGANASFVISPANTSSHSVAATSAATASEVVTRSPKKAPPCADPLPQQLAPARPRASAPWPAGRAAARPRGSRGRPGPRRRRTRRPRRPRRGRRAAPAGSPARAASAPPARGSRPAAVRPCSCTITSRSRSVPPRPPSSTPCQRGRNRASVSAGTASTSARSRASEARRIRRSTSASHHSSPCPPGRIAPRTTVPSTSSVRSSSSTRCRGTPRRSAGSSSANGPCVRANRATRPRSACSTGSMNASGRPGGGSAPTPSR